MSRSIDERIVSMQFENSKFEKNVQTTLKTLDNLKQALNFEGAAKGLNDLQKAGDSFTLARIAESIDQINDRFTLLGQIGFQALERIASKAVDAGEKLIKSLSVDQISAGFSKYEEYSKNVKTIMSATGKDAEEVGTYLDKLVWYADETSYSLQDMTNNIGKFTNNGVDLDLAVTAMMGISNASALAGAGVQQASHAMEGFSKAIAQGKMTRMTWQWVKTSRMDTKAFKELVLENATALGTLQKIGDGQYMTADGTYVAYDDFETAMKEGWFNDKVILKTLNDFGAATNDIYEKTLETGLTASEVLEQLGDDYGGLSIESFKAAQEARTFTDAIDAVKDAVSSKWLKTFELIFGNVEESTELWTDFANGLWDIFAAGGDARNAILGHWNENGGRLGLFQGIYDICSALVGILDAVKESLAEVFPVDFLQVIWDATLGIREFGAQLKSMFTVQKVFDGWEEVEKLYAKGGPIDVFQRTLERGIRGDDVKKMQEHLMELGISLDNYGADGIFGPETQAALEEFQKKYGLAVTGVYDEATHNKMYEVLGLSVDDLYVMDKVEKYIDYIPPELEALKSILRGLFSIVKIGVSGLQFAWGVLTIVIDTLSPLGALLFDLASYVGDFFYAISQGVTEGSLMTSWLTGISDLLTPVKEKFEDVRWSVNKFIQDRGGLTGIFQPVIDFFFGNENQADLFTRMRERFSMFIDIVGNSAAWARFKAAWAPFQANLEKAKEYLLIFWEVIKNVLGNVFSSISGDAADGIPLLEKIAMGILDFASTILEAITSGGATLGEIIPAFFQGIGEAFGSVFEIVKPIIDKVFGFFEGIGGGIGGIADSIINFITEGGLGNVIIGLLGAGAGAGIVKSVWNFGDVLESVSGVIDGAGELLESIGGVFDSIKSSMKSKNILRYAKALALVIGAIVASIYVLGTMPRDQLIQGAIAVGGIIIVMGGIITLINILVSKMPFTQLDKLKKFTGSLVMLGACFLLMTLAIKILGSMGLGELMQGIAAIGAILTILGLFSLVFGLAGRISGGKAVAGLVQMAFAVILLTIPIAVLGHMDPAKVQQGIVALGGILAIVGVFSLIMAVVSRISKGGKIFGGLLFMALAIDLLMIPVVVLGLLPRDRVIQGVASLGAIMALVAIFSAVMSFIVKKLGSPAGVFLSLTGMAVALTLLVVPVTILGLLPKKLVEKGIVSLGLIMGLVAAFTAVMGIATKMSGGNKLFVGLIGMAVALTLLVIPVTILGLTPTKVLKRGLGTLLILMAIVAAFSAVMAVINKKIGSPGSAINGIKSVIPLVIMIGVMTAAVIALGMMNPDQLKQGLSAMIGICGALLALSVAAHFMSKGGSFKNFAKGAIAIVGALAIVIGGLALLIGGLGALDEQIGGAGVRWIQRGGDILAAIREALEKGFGNDGGGIEGLLLALGSIIGACAAVGKFVGWDVVAGAAAIEGALYIIVVGTSALLGGLGALDAMDDGKMFTDIQNGGRILWGIRYALAMGFGFDMDDISDIGIALAAIIGACTAVGVICPMGTVEGAAAIETAFWIITIGTSALLGGLGMIDQLDNGQLFTDIQNGGRVLWSIRYALAMGFGFDMDAIADIGKALGAIIGACLIVGKIGALKTVEGAAAIESSLWLLAWGTSCLIGGLGHLDNLDGGAISEDIRAGGSLLAQVRLALGEAFGFSEEESDIKKIGAVLGIIVGACTAVGAIGATKAIEGAAAIGVAFDVIVILLGGLFVGLGKLDDFAMEHDFDIAAYIERGADLVSRIGTALGGFFGEIGNGVAFGVQKGINDANAEKDANAISNLGGYLETFQTAMKDVPNDVGDTPEKTDTAISLMQKVADFANGLPDFTINETLFAFVTGGETKLTSFLKGFNGFGPAMKTFYRNMKAVSVGGSIEEFNKKVDWAIEIMGKVGEFTNSLDDLTGADAAFALITGDSKLTSFLKGFIGFGAAMNIFTRNMSAVNEVEGLDAKTQYAVKIAGYIRDFSNSLDGLEIKDIVAKVFTGETTFSQFIKDLGGFARMFNMFSKEMKAVSTNDTAIGQDGKSVLQRKTEAAVLIAGFVRDFSASLPEKSVWDKFGEVFTGTAMENFADDMGKFGEGMASFVQQIKPLEESRTPLKDVETAVRIGKKIAEFLSDLSDSEQYSFDESGLFHTSSFDKLMGQLGQLGTGISTFITNTKDIDLSHMSSLVSEIRGFADVLQQLGDLDYEKAILALEIPMEDFKNYFNNDLPNGLDTAVDGASGYGDALAVAVGNGIKMSDSVTNNLGEIVQTAIDITDRDKKTRFETLGKNLIAGLQGGFERGQSSLNAAVSRVVAGAILTAKTVSEVASPSKVFAEIGRYWDEGLANGVSDTAYKVDNSVSDMANGPIAQLSSMMAGDIDYDPVIRPVVDTDGVARGISAINGMFARNQTAVSTSENMAQRASAYSYRAEERTMIQNGTMDVVNAIHDTNDRIEELGYRIEQMKMVVDSGALVGQIARTMDKELGIMATVKGRMG